MNDVTRASLTSFALTQAKDPGKYSSATGSWIVTLACPPVTAATDTKKNLQKKVKNI